jgi:SAM-dependent methyltransferase
MKKAQSYLKIVKRHIISNKYFWKYRHVFQRKIFETSYGNLLKHHYDDTFRHVSKESILDFGCATGDKLEYFINCGSKNIYGIDINSKALRTAEAKIKNFKVNYKFSNQICLKDLKKFLSSKKIKKFDLIIFDRVLFVLDDNEFNNVLLVLSKLTKYIYIDDFFPPNNHYNEYKKLRFFSNGYRQSNFDKILEKKNFILKIKRKSPYRKVEFSNTNSALYKLINL